MTGSFTGNNAFDARVEYQNAMAGLTAPNSGLNADVVNRAQCTQSFLRLEQPINTTQNAFEFPIQTNVQGNSGVVRSTERRLAQQDAFYVARMQFYIANASSATATNFPLYTYPSPTIFTGTGEAAGLQTIYNGMLRLTMNGVVVQPGFPMSNFLNVPQTQKTAATNSPIDEINGVDAFSFQPNPVLIGSNNNQLVVVLPSAITGTLTANDYMVIILQGILAQNVTNLVVS